MSNPTTISQQDFDTSILMISYLTDRMRQSLEPEERSSIANKEEAVKLLSAFLSVEEIEDLQERLTKEQATLLLNALYADESVKPELESLLNTPPQYSQRSFERPETVAVILGCLVTWLQTKIHIHIKRANGKTSFEFQLVKPKASDAIVKEVIKTIKAVLGQKDQDGDKNKQ